jgi:hypothetical protein
MVLLRCIYCNEDKPESDFTLEHTIPKFLGGAYAPDDFKVRAVCGPCNHNLGLFVDTGFEKCWFVNQALWGITQRTFDYSSDAGMQLNCLGTVKAKLPGIKDDEVCEVWLGPHGEQVYWVRQDDKRTYWYSGGNPRTAKSTPSRAYFTFSIKSELNVGLAWRTFRDAFAGRKVKKLMMTTVPDADITSIGFSDPDELDLQRMEFLRTAEDLGHGHLSIYVKYDVRFMAKLGLGVGFALFGRKATDSDCAAKLRRALTSTDEDAADGMLGTGAFQQKDEYFLKLSGDPNAVALWVSPHPDGVALNLNIGATQQWIVKCADIADVDYEKLQHLNLGRGVLLYEHLRRSVSLSSAEFIAHQSGSHVHPELAEIATEIARRQSFRLSSDGKM